MTGSAAESLREKALSLPLSPGVYIFSDGEGKIIYIGKAKILKNRVSSYFHSNLPSPKVRAMVASARELSYIGTSSELEALILECSLIKRHKPKYNILLKDDKGYPFIRLDLREPYPRMEVAAKRAADGASYFGPYGGRSVAYSVIDSISALLKLPLCSRSFPRDVGKARPCLHFQTGACYGPCRTSESQEKYAALTAQAVMILQGKYGELEAAIRSDMEAAAEALEFERAAALRDRLLDVEKLGEKQKIITGTRGRVDAVGCWLGTAKIVFSVLSVAGGVIASQDMTSMKLSGSCDAAEALASFLKQYYPGKGELPDRILVSREFEDMPLLAQLLTEERGRAVSIEQPKRGLNRRLLSMAEDNARREFLRTTSPEEKQTASLAELERITGLSPLKRLEAFDISNTGASGIVGAMAVFENGKPKKSEYRRYAIRSTATPDDYASMREVITRRISHLGEGERPDLLLIDGGSEHAATARDVLDAAGLTIPVLGMVKDDRHRTRALITPEGAETGLETSPAAFTLVAAVQEEVHRYALAYHKTRRKKETLVSGLEAVPGIGPSRRAALVKHFGSAAKVKAASGEQLAAVLPRRLAQEVFAHFHAETQN